MNQEKREQIVVIGAGHGGGSVVAFLRQYGYNGDITLIGAESFVPYQRPPLSKDWLKGEVNMQALMLRPASFYVDQKIRLQLGIEAKKIDIGHRRVALSNGEELAYDQLILAMGADARSLQMKGAEFDNVMTMRTLVDAERIRSFLGPGKKLVIIGGGYVGLECAATARAMGTEVVIIERAPRLLERVASTQVSTFLHKFHQNRGVTIAVNAELAAIDGINLADGIRLTDGRRFECDALLVGIGSSPAVALAETAGLACNDGILVDTDCRSSVPHIFALGDVAKRPHSLYNRNLRLESVPSVMEQAKRVAAVLTGRTPAPAEVPWFWSDQYDLKLQIAGLPFEARETVVRGDPAVAKFAVYHLCDGRVVTVEAINAPQEFFAGKKLISSGKIVDNRSLSDTSVSLNQLVA